MKARIVICYLLLQLAANACYAQPPVMLIEVPAGTNAKYEFNKESGEFQQEIINDAPRSVDFLPYPGNYGYIKNTLMDTVRGGDGDALDILLLASALPRGSSVEVIPIAILHLLDNGEIDDKVIAVTVDPDLQIISCKTLACLKEKYPAIPEILKTWFTNYKGAGVVRFKGWKDEKEAAEAIRYWQIR